MRHALAPPRNAASGGCSGACALVLAVLCLPTSGARAELLGTHPHRNGTVHLMPDLYGEHEPSAGQPAQQTVGGRGCLGCWDVDRASNPVGT